MTVSRINHVSVRALDLATSVSFYERLLDAKPILTPNFGGRTAWLSIGTYQLHLFQRGEQWDKDAHFALEVEDFESVYHRAEEMEAFDRVGSWGHHFFELPGGEAQLYIRDPARNLIEVVHPRVSLLSATLRRDLRRRSEQFSQNDEQRRARLFMDRIACKDDAGRSVEAENHVPYRSGQGSPVTFATADLVDEHPGDTRSCLASLRQYGGRARFYGQIRTLRCYEDNVLVKETLSEPGDGAVLVVDGGGSVRCALVGDVIAGLGVRNGWSGMVIWGAVRDTKALGALDIGIKALGSNPAKSAKTGAGHRGTPVSFGDVTFRPGEWIYADEDGTLVSENRIHR